VQGTPRGGPGAQRRGRGRPAAGGRTRSDRGGTGPMCGSLQAGRPGTGGMSAARAMHVCASGRRRSRKWCHFAVSCVCHMLVGGWTVLGAAQDLAAKLASRAKAQDQVDLENTDLKEYLAQLESGCYGPSSPSSPCPSISPVGWCGVGNEGGEESEPATVGSQKCWRTDVGPSSSCDSPGAASSLSPSASYFPFSLPAPPSSPLLLSHNRHERRAA